MCKAYLSQEEAPQTPIRGLNPQSELNTPIFNSFLSPTTPGSSSNKGSDGIFSPPSSVHTDATDDDEWNTPTKTRPGRSNKLFSTSPFQSPFDQLKTESSPRASPGLAGLTDNTECFIGAQALFRNESSHHIQKLNFNNEDFPELAPSLDGATSCGHHMVRYLVQAQQSTRGRSASLGHIESYASQIRVIKATEYPRSRSLERWSLRCQKGCDKLRASCAPPSTPIVPNIEVSPPKNASNVTTVAKASTLSDLALPTAKTTENFLFKFDISFSEELNHRGTSGEAKAADDSSFEATSRFRVYPMNLKPDINFLRGGESHRRESRSLTRVDTISSGARSNHYPKGPLTTNISHFVHTDDTERVEKAHGISLAVGTNIQSGNDQEFSQTDTAEGHTDRKYVHQTLIPNCPKRYKWKSISEVLEKIIITPLRQREIEREGYIYIYWHPGNFGRVKIGCTKNVEKRLRQWESQCKKKLYNHFPKEAERGYPVQHITRVEKLVHAELKNHRRQELQCPGCGKRHVEWFEVEKDVAVDVVRKWTNWMRQMPYIQKVYGDERQWVLKDEARKLLGDIFCRHTWPSPAFWWRRRAEQGVMDYWKIYADAKAFHDPTTGAAYDKYGIDLSKGAVAVVRPDGYVALVTQPTVEGMTEVTTFKSIARPLGAVDVLGRQFLDTPGKDSPMIIAVEISLSTCKEMCRKAILPIPDSEGDNWGFVGPTNSQFLEILGRAANAWAPLATRG
ncbi:hypothetical protein FE257_009314 [Aspergillus nanangensis]|uniref:Bacteriophage T5 Orf172 DNA-binding domain-containing protein n=1 Tax=Aspergillus nanangensis TaxID=2582783 RepID=A0AAD4CK74_ASPNN|nr:hypothetical protein FE257_009314 [Aspergillus nanangensis]